MTNSEKITIRGNELPTPPAAAEKIVIREDDLPYVARVASPTPPVRPASVPVHAILIDEPPPSPQLPLAVWVAATLVPFFNSWIWWHYAPPDHDRRLLFRAVASVLAVASLFGSAGLLARLAQLTRPQPDWVEEIASRADRSVVLVHTQPDSFGSGFVIASRGNEHLILTNRHVVVDAENCRVLSRVAPETTARVAGFPSDSEIDLALLVVQAPGLRPLGPIGQFRNVRVGEAVVAIGHPLGLDYTVTTGIVSAKRGGVELQTSAPISPGNSGGPLIDRRGRIVGVNTRTVNPVEGQSLGFATRADLVLDISVWDLDEDIDHLLSNIDR